MLRCSEQLSTALQSLDRELVHFLLEEGFITENLSEKVLNPLTLLSAADKAGLLVPRIRDRVKLSFQDYHKLVEYLRLNKRKHGSIVDILDKEYNRKAGIKGRAWFD